MAQVVLFEQPGLPRDTLAYMIREAQIDLGECDDPARLRQALEAGDVRVALVSESLLDEWLAVAAKHSGPKPQLWVLAHAGSFRGIVQSLHHQAEEIISRDGPTGPLLARLKGLMCGEMKAAAAAVIAEERIKLLAHVDGQPHPIEVAPHRLLSVVSEVCDVAAQLQKRYDAELAQRRRVEHALMESEAFYQSLVETLPLSLFRKDLQGRVTFANQLMCKALNRTASEILGKTDYDFFPKELAEKYRADDRRVMESREGFETTEEFQTPSGELRYTHVVKTPVLDAAGKLVGVQGMFSDVTDHIRAEAALEQERYLLDNLMKSIPDNIYFKDAQGRYLRINPAKARRSGLKDPGDAIGKSDVDFFPPEHARQAWTDEQEVMRSGEGMIAKEEQVHYGDGETRWMATTKLPLRDRQGTIVGTFGLSHDITQLKEAQQALREAADAADAANRAKSDFLANMSHEIRTPLNAVLGMTELVLDSPLTPVQRDYLKLVRESGESLLAVINDILDFSKIEAGKLQLDQTSFELREFLGDTMKSLGLRAHRKRLELACDIASNVPDRLLGDANRLRQVVVNLLSNAIKFTEHGEVVLSVQAEPAEGEDVVLHFRVSDTGIGIPADKFATIFEAFEQADRSTTRKFGGTGLGLAISARLVELMEGRIWVESEIGQGSTFHFTAKFTVTAEEAERTTSATPELLQGLKVLVVDDNSTNRRILAEMLSSWGMAPQLATSAQEALEVLRRAKAEDAPFGLVVTDVNMPEQSGFDLVLAAQSEGTLCRGMIVMLTSSDRSEDLDLCRKLGVSTYLIKPIKQSELFNAILQSLGAAHAEEWTVAQTSMPRVSARPLDILLAEDSPINQQLAVGLLERWGHRVTVAEDGQQAIDAVKKRRFDMVLMDVQMPDVDGLEATRSIRVWEQESGSPALPIVAMTAHALQGDRDRCISAGMDDYLTKPIRSELLFQMVERFATGDGLVTVRQDGVKVPAAAPEPVKPVVRPAAEANGGADWNHALGVTGNDPVLLRDITEAFVEEGQQLAQRLTDSSAAQDLKQLKRTAHTLKTAFGTFGFDSARQVAQAIERDCQSDQPPIAPDRIDQLARLARQLTEECRGRLQSESSSATMDSLSH
ncbi:MAG TPA: response regulator [Planctomycetaceae bacterium]|nr:response regulator [Planctomycetaceae bacterium]